MRDSRYIKYYSLIKISGNKNFRYEKLCFVTLIGERVNFNSILFQYFIQHCYCIYNVYTTYTV